MSIVNIFTLLDYGHPDNKVVSMRTFCEKLRGLREDNDLTQVQIAEVLGTSQTMYARYERGANEMPIHHLITLCRFYNVSADYLLDTAPDSHRPFRTARQTPSPCRGQCPCSKKK